MANRGKPDATKAGWSRPRLSPEPKSVPEPDANERLLTRMEAMMEDMRSDIVSRFEQIISETVKREITGDGESPQAFVIRVNMFQQRNDILRKARAATPLYYKGKRILAFSDYTALY